MNDDPKPDEQNAEKARKTADSVDGNRERGASSAAIVNVAPELDEAVGFWLRRAVGIADGLFGEVFAAHDISTQLYAIMMTIRHNPGCQPSTLSASLHITPNNLVPHVAELVSRGYVRRVSSSRDRRIKHLRLTAAGEEFALQLIRRHEEIRARLEGRMGAEKLRQLVDLLRLYCG